MKRIKKLVAVTGKFKASDGTEKNSYVNCGTLFKREDGTVCIKLDALPLGEFNGWINVYDLDPPKGQQEAAQPAAQPAPASNNFDDDIPF